MKYLYLVAHSTEASSIVITLPGIVITYKAVIISCRCRVIMTTNTGTRYSTGATVIVLVRCIGFPLCGFDTRFMLVTFMDQAPHLPDRYGAVVNQQNRVRVPTVAVN